MDAMQSMDTWNSVIFIKSDKSMADMRAVAQWEGVESMWSTTGDWDWCVKLDKKSSSPEKAEMMVSRMRKEQWATSSKTNWWKEVAGK